MEQYKTANNGLRLVALSAFLIYGLGIAFPDLFWGVHYPSFLPSIMGGFLVFVGLSLVFLSAKMNPWGALDKEIEGGWYWKILLAFLAAIIYYNNPIFLDVYGDAPAILPDQEFIVKELDPLYLNKLFSLDFTNLKLGTGTTFGLVGWISYNWGITVYEGFRIVGAICGAGFVFFMIASIHRVTKKRSIRFLMTLAVFGAPFALGFCGHVEVYAPVYMLLAAFWYVTIRYMEKSSTFGLLVLIALVFLNLKFHITGGITLLVFFAAILIKYYETKEKHLSWKRLLAIAVAPVYFIGIIVYLFVTKSAFGTRQYTEENLTDAIFLPISASDPPPFDRYNLFSWNHIFDYLNLLFLWSAIALVIIVALIVFFRNRINWNNRLLQISGVAMLIYLPVFFVLNPLLSMQTDWDLMSIPGITMILFALSLLHSLDSEETKSVEKESSVPSMLLSPSIVLVILGFSAIMVNAKKESQSERLISAGVYSYKTYWIGSSSLIFPGVNLLETNDERGAELERIVRKIGPYGVKGNDVELSAILNRLGDYYQHVEEDHDLALETYERAFECDSLYRKNVYDVVVMNFMKQRFKKATNYLHLLVAMKYPNEQKALRIAIHTSIEAEDYVAAKDFCIQLLKKNPNDTFIQEILQMLESEGDKSKIKLRFRQS